MTQTAIDLIARAGAEGWKELDLSGLGLSSVPEELATLVTLERLNLGWNGGTRRGNNLRELPDWISQLSQLQSLDLSMNLLRALPRGLSNLLQLQDLDLIGNYLNQLPPWMAGLTRLRSLFLSGNGLTHLSDWLSELNQLQFLSLSRNELSELPPWLSKLSRLQGLDLSVNHLTELPECLAQLALLESLDLSGNGIRQLPDWLADPQALPKLTSLHLSKNPLTVPPPELLGDALTGNTPAPLDAIRSYFRQLQAETAVYFYEAKLLIIGEGGAGKTSLARKLQDPACRLLPDQKSTEGIDIINWSFQIPKDLPPNHEKTNYTVKIWDFGGQEIYFATHQFFLTKRSVYLLVADTRRQHTDFYTWLLMQETFGGDSPVILVKNRNRQHGNSFAIENLFQLREQFPNLQEPLEVDLHEVPAGFGWSQLLQKVQERLLALPHIQQPRPATWVAVRRAIGDDKRNTINRAEFFTICRDKGIKENEDIKNLADYMHNVGDILYFQEDRVLQNCVILNPRWGLDAVYRVLDNREIERNLGKFHYSDLRTLWNDPKYQDYHNELLRLMANFQLCYELPGEKDTYIAPQLLGEAAPDYSWDTGDNLQLRYDYPDFMPHGILSRAIVKLHKSIENQRLVWRSGVVLGDGYARAELLELRSKKQIQVRVSGRHQRDLLMEVVRTLDELHRAFPKLNYRKLVPCNCPACVGSAKPHFFDFEALRQRLANQKQTIECDNPPYSTVLIPSLLNETGLWRSDDRVDMKNIGPRNAISPHAVEQPHASGRQQVFISYSHKDEKFLADLMVHLRLLERAGHITTWSERRVAPGAQWMDEIRQALAIARVAVLMVSPDFLASDFIHHHELRPLLEKAKQQGVRILWVPVRASAVHDTPLARYQAVIAPEKPLAGMTDADRDAALLKIYEAIKEAASRPQ